MDLKEIIQHNYLHSDTHIEIRVPFSRFRLIYTSYQALRGLNVDEIVEAQLKAHKDYTLYSIKGRTNSYKIIKTNEAQVIGKCKECNCNRKRYINSKTGDCYYNESIKNNYTTKLVTL
jgi:hypothetical protein